MCSQSLFPQFVCFVGLCGVSSHVVAEAFKAYEELYQVPLCCAYPDRVLCWRQVFATVMAAVFVGYEVDLQTFLLLL